MNEINRKFRKSRGFGFVETLNGYVFTPEANAHTFKIQCVVQEDNLETVVPFETGSVVSARFLKSDHVTELVEGSLDENGAAVVTLPAECYAVPGRFLLTIMVAYNSISVCVYAATGTVIGADSGTVNLSQNASREIDEKIAELNAAAAQVSSAISAGSAKITEINQAAAAARASIPQDYTALSDSVGDLKSAVDTVTGNEIIQLSPGYINTSVSTVDLDTVGTGDFYHAIVACSPGDVFTINGVGAGTARLWAWVKSDGTTRLDDVAGSTATADDNLIKIAPAEAAYFVFNTRSSATNKSCFKGKVINERLADVQSVANSALPKSIVKSFTVNAGGVHSSLLDKITISISSGKDYFVLLNASESVTMEVNELDSANTNHMKGSFKFDGIGLRKETASVDIASIGLSVSNSNDSSATVSFAILTDVDISTWTVANELHSLEYDLPFDDVVENYVRSQNYDSVVEDYAGILQNCGKSDQFVYFTDPHLLPSGNDYQLKFYEYTGVIGRMYDKTSTEFVLCGGDWLVDGTTPTEAFFRLNLMDGRMKELFGERYFPMFGNHDDNIQGVAVDGVKQFSQDMIDNSMFSRFGKSYYSFDSARATYYVLDSEQDSTPALSMNTHKWQQINWLAESLKDKDSTNNVICMHIFFNYPFTVGDSLVALADNAEKVAAAYNNKTTVTLNGTTYDFTNTTGKVRFMIGGHLHSDSSDITNYSVPIIMRTTTLEGRTPCFDLAIADWDNKKLKMLRIGGNRAETVDEFNMAN